MKNHHICILTIIIKNHHINIMRINVTMINLSFDELRLIAQRRNISDYEKKSKEDLAKVLSETKPETPKLEIRLNKRKLKKLR